MSTRTDTTHDDTATTSPRTDATTDDFSDTERSTATTTPTESLTPNGDASWTNQCKRQFSTASTTRMRNLNDDENHAMHDGV
jgi:hypothetical protein